jgi:hypothetical protein
MLYRNHSLIGLVAIFSVPISVVNGTLDLLPEFFDGFTICEYTEFAAESTAPSPRGRISL